MINASYVEASCNGVTAPGVAAEPSSSNADDPRVALTLGPTDVHVHYRLFDAVNQEDQDAAMRTISSVERERAGRFVFARDRLSFVIAHALLRQALSTYSAVEPDAWRFLAGRFGKPALAAEFTRVNLHFNLAHTDGLVACVVSHGDRVGIDVKATDRRIQPLELARRHFSPREITDLQVCSQDELSVRFVEIWTLKEAYVKAIGMGLSRSLQGFSFRFEGQSSIHFEASTPTEAPWAFALFAPSERHRMAVAARRSVAAIRITAWPMPDAPAAAALRYFGVTRPALGARTGRQR